LKGIQHHFYKRETEMIDLYSDTVTRPAPAMREAIAKAEVGDEQRGEDPTTNALQECVAEMLGTEASIFLPSATMANVIACRLHTQPGEAVILDASCHLLNSEGGGLAIYSHIVPRIINGDRGQFTPEQVAEQITGEGYYRPKTTLLACEQTHNLCGGTVWKLGQLQAVCDVAQEHGLKTHLDGSRLMNAVVATGISATDYCARFDTVTLCLSKGLGCPVGALLAGTTETIARARKLKQQFGGSMRQSGILAAAGLYALAHHVARLAEDHANALRLAEGLAEIPTLDVETPVETNMVFVGIQRTCLTGSEAVTRLRAAGVNASQPADYRLRFVTHLDVTAEDIDRAVERICAVLGKPNQ
jgi:threonine aldolase